MRTFGTQHDGDLRSPDLTAMLPAWLLSVALHLFAAIAGTVFFRGLGPSREPTAEPARLAEIVLARREANATKYFSEAAALEGNLLSASSVPAVGTEGGSGSPLSGSPGPPPVIAGLALPLLEGPTGNGGESDVSVSLGPARGKPRIQGNLDEAALLAADALIPREKVPTGPTAQMSLFGMAAAEGRSFVFVIDRSKSMGGDGLGAIAAAARELRSHLNSLGEQQTFQVIAYNQSLSYLTRPELIPAEPANQQKLVQFVAGLAAFGQTEHGRALMAALRLKPEVIFLLTDGGDPAMNPAQLRLVREQAAGRTTIHSLHFGRGTTPIGGEFLARLAADNHGTYTYIDMNSR
jgi:hypothetical protein